MSMTIEEARAAVKTLGWTQKGLADQMSALTGRTYHQATVAKWLSPKGRGPSDACVIMLKLSLKLNA